MKNLTNAELLEVWEQGQGQSAARCALLLLRAAFPEVEPPALAQLSIGQRDSYLMALREWLFGPQLISVAACPMCQSRLELNFSLNDIRMETETRAVPLLLRMAEYELEFRLPNSLDLLKVTDRKGLTVSRQAILEGCILRASYGAQATGVEQLPPEIIEALANEMARADPQADVQLALACTDCGHKWQASFDIVTFLWAELNAWACRLLQEVHRVALAYGWREADILALSQNRRQFYLEMISQVSSF